MASLSTQVFICDAGTKQSGREMLKIKTKDGKPIALFLCAIILVMKSLFPFYCTFACLETCSFQSKEAVCSKSFSAQCLSRTNGEIVVCNNETCIINYEFRMVGNIIIKDNATLIIRDSIFNQTHACDRIGIVVKNRACLIITNATLIINKDCSNPTTLKDIMLQERATLTVVDSSITNPKSDCYIYSIDNSVVNIDNSSIAGSEGARLVTNDYSEVRIRGSNLSRVVAWGSSTVSIENSILSDTLKTYNNCTIRVSASSLRDVSAYGSPKLYFRNSNIRGNVVAGMNSNVWLIRTLAQNVSAGGDSNVWLIDASAEALYEFEKATVFVGWDLPLLGPVSVHHTLVSVVRIIVIIAVAVTVSITLFVMAAKVHKRGTPKSSRGS